MTFQNVPNFYKFSMNDKHICTKNLLDTCKVMEKFLEIWKFHFEKTKKLTDAGGIECENRRRSLHSPLAGYRTRAQTDDSAVFFVHEAKSPTVAEILSP